VIAEIVLGVIGSITAYGAWIDHCEKRDKPKRRRISRAQARQNKKWRRYAAAQREILPATASLPFEKPARKARAPRAPVRLEVPAFLVDTESALINLGYKRSEAKNAIERSSGDDFPTRLKRALEILRVPVQVLNGLKAVGGSRCRGSIGPRHP
jgi:hypothetical protein